MIGVALGWHVIDDGKRTMVLDPGFRSVSASDTGALRARVTADPERMRFAANYADLILKSADYGDQGSSPFSQPFLTKSQIRYSLN